MSGTQPTPPERMQRPSPDRDAENSHRPDGVAGLLQQDEFSLRQAIGGPRGVAESVLPTLVFVVLFVALSDVLVASLAAVAVVAVALVLRLVQRQSVGSAIGGLVGVAIGALLAIRSGEGSTFYTPGIVTNGVAAVVLALSLLLRQPLVGVFIGLIEPRVQDWRSSPDARRTYTTATIVFLVLYVAKVAVQLPLLLTGQVAALGVAKIAMGLPAFAVIAYLVWLMHRGLMARRRECERD